MARRLYLGRLPMDARSDDVARLFDGCGRIVDVRVMTGFGFVEFESTRDAEDALNAFNGKSFMGTNIVVEFAKESRPKRDTYDADRGVRARRPPGFRIAVSGISRDTSWQDLKDFGREAGGVVVFADIDRDNSGEGVLEYQAREDADRAVKQLDGKDLRGRTVRVVADNDRGPDNYRREERRDDRYRDTRERYREDRPLYRRERSRSPPPRRDVEERRPRSPRREFEDRRPSGYDRREERRAPEPHPREARDERRREERKRDEKDDRFDDRAPRYSNGDAGYR